jgi:hypothetical protein
VLALHQAHFHTLAHDLFKQLLEQARFLKPPMTVLGKCRVMRDLLIETQTREPAPRPMHAQFLHQLALAGDAVQIANQQNAQQQLGINRGATGLAVTIFQLFTYEGEADVFFDQPQQVGLRNLIVQAEVVEQRFGTAVLPHHDEQASESGDPTEHGKDFFLLPRFG